MRNDVPTMEAGPAGADAAAGRVRWVPVKSLGLVGMAGPVGMPRTHDLRDWAQRQPQCHDHFGHRGRQAWPTQTSQGRTT